MELPLLCGFRNKVHKSIFIFYSNFDQKRFSFIELRPNYWFLVAKFWLFDVRFMHSLVVKIAAVPSLFSAFYNKEMLKRMLTDSISTSFTMFPVTSRIVSELSLMAKSWRWRETAEDAIILSKSIGEFDAMKNTVSQYLQLLNTGIYNVKEGSVAELFVKPFQH